MPIPWMPNPDTTSPDLLNDWYERTVGYHPQEDDPNMSDDDLRALVRSYIAEIEKDNQ